MDESDEHGKAIRTEPWWRPFANNSTNVCLICPTCESGNVQAHATTVVVHTNSSINHSHNPLHAKGGWVEINLTCVAGHEFRIATGSHGASGNEVQVLDVVPGHTAWGARTIQTVTRSAREFVSRIGTT
jgi:hypothetical protein